MGRRLDHEESLHQVYTTITIFTDMSIIAIIITIIAIIIIIPAIIIITMNKVWVKG